MSRNRFIYLTDLMLVPVFILSLYTGIEIHIAGHGIDHEIWHDWAVFHTVAGLLFMALGIIHIKSHWGWYKGLKTLGCRGKRKIVFLLSIVFISVIITGALLLFCIDGANSAVGLLHYKIGLAVGVLGILHILKRKRFLYKGFVTHVVGINKERLSI